MTAEIINQLVDMVPGQKTVMEGQVWLKLSRGWIYTNINGCVYIPENALVKKKETNRENDIH